MCRELCLINLLASARRDEASAFPDCICETNCLAAARRRPLYSWWGKKANQFLFLQFHSAEVLVANVQNVNDMIELSWEKNVRYFNTLYVFAQQ